MAKVKAKYFDKDYWTTGTKSGYTVGGYNRTDYINAAKAGFLVGLYGTEGKWLEAGCSFGWVEEQLLNLGVDAYGFDISKYAIKNCPEIVRDRLKCSDGLKPKLYKESQFDRIVSFETAEHVHITDVDSWIANLVRWLKPGGDLFLTICVGYDNIRGIEDNDVSHQTLQPREWWEEKLEELGLIRDNATRDRTTDVLVETEHGPEYLARKYGWHCFAWRNNHA